MADYHVLSQDAGSRHVHLLLHIPTPVGDNFVNVPYATAIINSGRYGATILPDGDGTGGTISASEKAAVLAGTLIEIAETWPLESAGATVAQIRDQTDLHYNARKAAIQEQILVEYKYFGYSRVVP